MINTSIRSTAVAMPAIREISLNGFFAVDRNWNVLEWNNAAAKLLRLEATEIIGHNFWNKFSGLLPVEFYAYYHKPFQIEEALQFNEYWAEMGAWFQGIVYATGDILSVSFTCSNQPANPEKKIKILRDLYLFVSEVTNDCLWEWDLQAKQLFWIDGGHKRVFGYPIVDALIPQSYWESRIHPDDKMKPIKTCYFLRKLEVNVSTPRVIVPLFKRGQERVQDMILVFTYSCE